MIARNVPNRVVVLECTLWRFPGGRIGMWKKNKLWWRLQEIGQTNVLTIFLIALSARFLLFVIFQPWSPIIEREFILKSDMLGHHRLGITLLESHYFAYSNQDGPETLRMPLYPMFIAVIYSLFGYRPWVVIFFQIVFDSLASVILLFSLSHLFSRKVALAASIFYALDPFLILYSSTTLYSDALFVFLLVVAFWFISNAIVMMSKRGALLYWGLSSLFFGFATLVKPISQYILVFCFLYFLIAYRKHPRTAFIYSVSVAVLFGVVLFPWFFRNYINFGYFSLSSSGSYNLLVLDVAPMEMAKRHEDIQTVKTSLLAEADSLIQADGLDPQELNGFQKSVYWQSLAKTYITNDPTGFVKSYFLGVTHMFFNLDTKNFLEIFGLPVVPFEMKGYSNLVELIKAFIKIKGVAGLLIGSMILLYLFISYISATVGLIVGWRLYNKPVLLLTLALALYFVVLTGPAGLARFKMPSIPFYLAFAGIGFSHLYAKYRPGKNSGECTFETSTED